MFTTITILKSLALRSNILVSTCSNANKLDRNCIASLQPNIHANRLAFNETITAVFYMVLPRCFCPDSSVLYNWFDQDRSQLCIIIIYIGIYYNGFSIFNINRNVESAFNQVLWIKVVEIKLG